jgi:hypothetical protein
MRGETFYSRVKSQHEGEHIHQMLRETKTEMKRIMRKTQTLPSK